jgi:alpha-tubulin suppressor-like RCC1 family protein
MHLVQVWIDRLSCHNHSHTIYIGSNAAGQIGDTFSTGTQTTQYRVGGWFSMSNVSMVSAGYRYSMALTTDGFVYSWGSNTYGVLGGMY